MAKMRICLYTETALPKMGGQEMVVDALAKQYLALGHDSIVLAPHPRLPLRANDAQLPYPVVRHPRFYSTRFFVSWYRWFLNRLYAKQPFDVLHCHGLYPPGYLAALSRHRLDIPVVITSHGGDVHVDNVRLAKPVLKDRHIQGLAAADALVAISRFTHDGFRRLCPQARRIVEIPNGVDLEPFQQKVRRPADLDPAIQPGEYAVFIGRLKHRKGVDVLLQALALLPPREAVELVIIGDGEERSDLEALTRQLGLDQRVRFVGKQVSASKIYLLQNALCGVVPSRIWEAFGLVVLEDYAAGIPVIASATPGLADLIQPGETGFTVPPESPQALADALRTLFNDKAAAPRMGDNARPLVLQYSWRTIAQRHLELYRELCESRSCRRDEGRGVKGPRREAGREANLSCK
jgi:glycosyltransferase involved in cell wall biosynthesis